MTRYGDGQIGQWRARAMALVMLALPGTVFIYNGSELGLPNVELPDEALQDPVWERSGHTERGRDGCRVPILGGHRSPYGFSSNAQTWLPMPHGWAEYTVERQLEHTDSMLSLYRRAIELRKSRKEFTGTSLEWYGTTGGAGLPRQRRWPDMRPQREQRSGGPARGRSHPDQRAACQRQAATEHRGLDRLAPALRSGRNVPWPRTCPPFV